MWVGAPDVSYVTQLGGSPAATPLRALKSHLFHSLGSHAAHVRHPFDSFYLRYFPAWGLFLATVQINNPRPGATPEQPPPRGGTASAGGDGGSASARMMWRGARRAGRKGAGPAVCLHRGSRGTASVCVR